MNRRRIRCNKYSFKELVVIRYNKRNPDIWYWEAYQNNEEGC